MFYSPRILLTSFAGIMLACSPSANGQISTWIGQQGQNNFENGSLWSSGVPDENTIATIGPHATVENTSVALNNDRSVGGLIISDGMQLENRDFRMTVGNLNGGGLVIAGANLLPDNTLRRSEFEVDGFGTPDEGFDLTVNGNLQLIDGGRLRMRGGKTKLSYGNSLTIDSQSAIFGNGRLVFGGGGGQTTIKNDGMIGSRTIGQLELIASGLVDLDGDNESGILIADGLNATLDIWAGSDESFDGTIQIGQNGTVGLRNAFGGWDYGTSTIEFNSPLAGNARSHFIYDFDSVVGGAILQVNGHGVTGGEFEGSSNLTGNATINVADDASLLFENTTANLTGRWNVGANGVLDFGDTLISANNVAVNLAGGTITGESTDVFNNSNPEGIRGYGQFELHVNNSMGITADGGELVIVGNEIHLATDNNIDWDGFYDDGRLRAEAGDLRLVDLFDSSTRGDVRVGGGHTLHVDGFRMRYDGYVLLNGGTVKSEDNQIFRGTVDVTRQSTMETFVSFEESVVVDLQSDLYLDGHTAFIDNTAMFSGSGDLVNLSTNRLVFDSGSFVDVDVINHGTISDENVEAPGTISLGNKLDNFGTINFALSGTDEFTRYDVAGDLMADNGVFRVFLVNDFNLKSGDQFDLLDFKSFIDNGFTFELPELCMGLYWDTADFVTEGILRVSGSLLGDINLDGVVNLLDIAPFVSLISDGGTQPEADINQDGVVNLFDIAPFVDLLQQSCQ